MIKLSRLLDEPLMSRENKNIYSLVNDSRKADEGSFFVAYSSYVADSHLFVDAAYQKGCRAFMVSQERQASFKKKYPDALWFGTNDLPRFLAEAAARFYNYPSKAFQLIGITGTNGKTTTANAVYANLTNRGIPAGLIGTIDYRIGLKVFPTNNTTPDVLELNQILHEMAEAGLKVVVMEVSSHALTLGRVLGLHFDVVGFTNVTQDHLDFHHTMEEYVNAKKKIISLLSESKSNISVVILNRDMDYYENVYSEAKKFPNLKIKTYSLTQSADYEAQVKSLSASETLFDWNHHLVQLEMIGLPNVANVTLAAAILNELGESPEEFLPIFENLHVKGRVERVKNDAGIHVVIDYAHTPDALSGVLKTLRAVKEPQQRLWCVFGAGGDRDRSKRPLMAKAAAKQADKLVLTSDNPRTEDPMSILNDLEAGLEGLGVSYVVEEDRKKAIFYALGKAREGDVVLIAGKGHEDYQIIGKVKHHFSDRETVESFFIG